METRELGTDESIRPLRRAEYDRLVEGGCFDGERLELLEGAIVRMSPQGELHAWVILKLSQLLFREVGQRLDVRVQLPLAASDDSEPEPDLAVTLPAVQPGHPRTALLVIEVSESTLAKDRHYKSRLYAAAGVPEYWVVNLVDGVLEIHTDPGDGYASVEVLRPGERVRSHALGHAFAVAEVVPVAK